ncbi:hypothetical protein ACIQ62_00570 [Streptomyces sp. NPDC096319]|uniref:hypothetical protein n=1 Tax=Streptomyces sp. NPDC096319 TaxID=3366084 RepID=UPI003811F808
MSASDQDTPTAEAPEADEPRKADEAQETPDSPAPEGKKEPSDPADTAEPSDAAETSDAAEPSDASEPEVPADGMTPKQARRLRVAAASVLLVALAVVLVIRLASRTSVLVVGVYGLAMILCGIVIELSRNGRTRLGTWLLVGGLLTALALDWLVLP